MASQAEVDLVISTAGTLPDLERDLSRILRQAENDADSVDVQVGVNAAQSLRRLDAELSAVINRVEGDIDGVQVGALINQRDAIRTLTRQVDNVVNSVSGAVDPVTIRGVLDSAQTLATVRTQLNRVADEIQRDIDPIRVDVDVDRDRLRGVVSSLRDFGRQAVNVAGSLGRLGLQGGAVGVSIGALVPVLASVAAAAAQVAPAAAVAVSGMLAIKLAAGTVQVAMIGVEDAIKDAFDPDVKPEEFQKSIARLAPEARKFVLELRSMRSGLRAVQQEVQNRFFQDFDETLRGLSRDVMPALRRGLNDTADVLNEMGRGAANAARELARNGTLGKAVDGATKGLENLKLVPAQIVTSLGQLAAASAPALDKLTRRIDSKSTEIADKLSKAFESKRMEDAIDRAITTIGQLFRVVGNFAGGVGNIFNGLTTNGRGLFDVLEDISQAFEDLTASEEFQTILKELSETAGVLVDAILPVLKEAFVQLAPVIEELAPVVRDFIKAIGPELIPLLQDLGPVLVDIAQIMREQLPTAIMITKGLIGVLSLAFRLLHDILQNVVIPVVRGVARVINSDLFNALSAGNVIVGIFTGETTRRFQTMAPGVGKGIKGARDIINGWAAELGGRILNAIQSAVDRIAARFYRLVEEIRNSIGRLPGQMIAIGQSIVNGLIRGITGSIGGLMAIVRGIADRITSTLRGALQIASPSKVMIGIGEDTADGLIVGLKRMIPQLEDTVAGMAGAITPSFALPDGQSLPLSPLSVGAPSVNVYIGNQALTSHIRTEIDVNNRARDRVLSQGVRR